MVYVKTITTFESELNIKEQRVNYWETFHLLPQEKDLDGDMLAEEALLEDIYQDDLENVEYRDIMEDVPVEAHRAERYQYSMDDLGYIHVLRVEEN